ncbi:glycosyltransferase, partial [bacterium]|nr:glycosyltransferase [bacterium]
MTQPLISIVTPTLNCGKYIRQCIESVIAQNYGNYEHIIIDGKSDDQTINIVKEYPHIKWISETDAGEVQALNKGILRASGELIGWLNADDWLDANAFKLVLNNLSEQDYIVYGNTKFYDNNDNMFWVKESNPNVDLKYLLQWFYAGSHPHQPSMFFRREVFQNVGKFNEQLVFSVDLEFWIRAILQYRFKYINGTLSHARLREDSKSWGTEKEQIESHWNVILPYLKKIDSQDLENFWYEYFCSRLFVGKAPENTKLITSEQYFIGLFRALIKVENIESSIVNLFPEYEQIIYANKEIKKHVANKKISMYSDVIILFNNLTKRIQNSATERKINVNIIGESEKFSSLAKINNSIRGILDNDTTLQYPDDFEVNISHNYPPLRKINGEGYWVTIQPWEFGSIPKSWVSLFNEKVDEVWVPSDYVRNVYEEGGVFSNKIHVIPNGFDESIYYPLTNINDGIFRFIFVGGMISRKGIDILLDAFNQEFMLSDKVQLVIKDFGSNNTYIDNEDHKTLLKIIRSNPNIKYIPDKLSELKLGELYRKCDCLVHPYRGEGFGMPILEAMACGLPVIVTKGGCTDEFVLDGLGYKIKSHRKSIGNVAGGRKLVADGWLLEPDMVSLREKMRWVFQNREESRKVGLNACDYVSSKYKWSLIGVAIKNRLAEIYKQRPVPLRIKNNVRDWELPNVVNIGRLQEPISLYLAKKHIQAFKECLNCISKRPFHPEAHLQLIDIVLDRNDYDIARRLSDRLVSLTPNWDVAININKKLRESDEIGSGIEWPELPDELSG